MKTLKLTLAALATTLLALPAARAQALEEIKVSYQPALYWALPFYVATEKNWWAEVGLKPVFSTFPAGVPQIAAAASKSWDVGGTGSVPAVLCLHPTDTTVGPGVTSGLGPLPQRSGPRGPALRPGSPARGPRPPL